MNKPSFRIILNPKSLFDISCQNVASQIVDKNIPNEKVYELVPQYIKKKLDEKIKKIKKKREIDNNQILAKKLNLTNKREYYENIRIIHGKIYRFIQEPEYYEPMDTIKLKQITSNGIYFTKNC